MRRRPLRRLKPRKPPAGGTQLICGAATILVGGISTSATDMAPPEAVLRGRDKLAWRPVRPHDGGAGAAPSRRANYRFCTNRLFLAKHATRNGARPLLLVVN